MRAVGLGCEVLVLLGKTVVLFVLFKVLVLFVVEVLFVEAAVSFVEAVLFMLFVAAGLFVAGVLVVAGVLFVVVVLFVEVVLVALVFVVVVGFGGEVGFGLGASLRSSDGGRIGGLEAREGKEAGNLAKGGFWPGRSLPKGLALAAGGLGMAEEREGADL